MRDYVPVVQISISDINSRAHYYYSRRIRQGVVTHIESVEPFATGIKMKSKDQRAIIIIIIIINLDRIAASTRTVGLHAGPQKT